jgi:predicted DNA-binding transcriptional regulator YafY
LAPMARAERMLELADALRGREDTTVDRLARTLGVSRRTVLRDLATLRERGLPITGEPGPGGGIRLEGDRGITAVHLAITEVVALWLAARLARVASELPWGRAADSGLAKLLGSLPRRRARELRALCHRVVVGPPASARVRADAGVAPTEMLRLFEDAFLGRAGLGFLYVDARGRTSVRRTEPHGLLVETPVWYVLARDLDRGAARTFRMDRVSRPRLLPEIEFVPDVALVRAQVPDSSDWRLLTDW